MLGEALRTSTGWEGPVFVLGASSLGLKTYLFVLIFHVFRNYLRKKKKLKEKHKTEQIEGEKTPSRFPGLGVRQPWKVH